MTTTLRFLREDTNGSSSLLDRWATIVALASISFVLFLVWVFLTIREQRAKRLQEQRRQRAMENLKNELKDSLTIREWSENNPSVFQKRNENQAEQDDIKTTCSSSSESSRDVKTGAADNDDESSSSGHDECAICLEPFQACQRVCESKNTKCLHIFHEDCMMEWLLKKKKGCPICREPYVAEESV